MKEGDKIIIVIGSQDGFIKLSVKQKGDNEEWETVQIFEHKIHGPVSTLHLFPHPTMFDHHAMHYEIGNESDAVSLFIGSCSGHSKIYSAVSDQGFLQEQSEYLSSHHLSATDICDAVLCSTSIILKGHCYVLFGTYSGKLICYRNNREKSPSTFSLTFEAQFDQQVQGITFVEDDQSVSDASRIILFTMNRVHFLNVRLVSNRVRVDHSKVLSV